MHTALLLEMAAGALGDRVATGSLDGGVSYDELAARARAGGHWLSRDQHDCGAQRGAPGDSAERCHHERFSSGRVSLIR